MECEMLKNEHLVAQISPVGAELHSLRTSDDLERIWQADPAIWGRHAPLLFPVIGRLKDQQYELDGEQIHMGIHGFCRDRVFDVVEKSDTHLHFRTQDDPDTRVVYPFSFTLDVEFFLEGQTLTKRHTVTNHSDRDMPFELGGHDAYCTTLLPGEEMSDYAIAFEGIDHLEPFGMDESGMLSLPKSVLPLEDGMLTKLPEQVGLDTIVVEDLPVRQATLLSRKSGKKLCIRFDDFPYLGIWTAQKGVTTNYICIEPWSTLPDGHFVGRKLTDKRGIRVLHSGESQTLSFSTTFM